MITGQQYGSAALHTVVKDRGVQQWGRWYSQAPSQWEAGIVEKKRVHLPQDAKRLPRTERPTHPPRTRQCTLHPPTHPPTHQTFTTCSSTAVQQYVHQNNSSAAVRPAVHLVRGAQLVGWFLRTLYETGNRRGGGYFLTILGHLGERASRRPPPTHHPPCTHEPTQYRSTAVQQYVEQYT